MKARLLMLILSGLALLSLAARARPPAENPAPTTTPTLTPTPYENPEAFPITPTPFEIFEVPPITPTPYQILNPEGQVSFSSLGQTRPLDLQGPLSSGTLAFSLPVDWEFQSGETSLHLMTTRTFSSLVPAQGPPAAEGFIVGTLNVWLNEVLLYSTPLVGSGSETLVIPIPPAALQADPSSGSHSLRMEWNAADACDSNLMTSLVVDPQSFLYLPHMLSAQVPLDLALYPRPFYQANAPETVPLVISVPDQPSPAELKAALAAAAGLGRLSGGLVSLSLLPFSQVSPELQAQTNQIIISRQPLELPANVPAYTSETEGALRLVASPDYPRRVWLVVSGNSDEQLLAAASALNTGFIIPGADPRLALVRPSEPVGAQPGFKEDSPLASLAAEDLLFNRPGSQRQQLSFDLPANIRVGNGAYLDLNLNHSQLLDYQRSGLVTRLNGVPFGSVRLSDATASGTVVRQMIPVSALHPGTNRLEFQADLTPRSLCADPSGGSLWINVLGQSLLHLPEADSSSAPAASLNTLAVYPQSLASSSNGLRWMLPANDPTTWNVAARLAVHLGAAGGTGRLLDVVFASDPAAAAGDGKNLLVIGQPQQLPMQLLNAFLPAPLDDGANLSPLAAGQAAFRLDASRAVGYLEVGPQPGGGWVLAVLGNNASAVEAAGEALIKTPRRLSAGNLGVVQGARLDVFQVYGPAAVAVPEAASPTVTTAGQPVSAVQDRQQAWVFPVMILSVLLVMSLIVYEIISTLRRNLSI